MDKIECEFCSKEFEYNDDNIRYGLINNTELGFICNQCDDKSNKEYDDYYGIQGDLIYDIQEDKWMNELIQILIVLALIKYLLKG